MVIYLSGINFNVCREFALPTLKATIGAGPVLNGMASRAVGSSGYLSAFELDGLAKVRFSQINSCRIWTDGCDSGNDPITTN